MRKLLTMFAVLPACSDAVLWADLDAGLPAGLLVLDRDPARGVLAYAPVPERIEVPEPSDRELDLLAYGVGFEALGLSVAGGRLALDAAGEPAPTPERWLHRAPGAATMELVAGPPAVDTILDALRVPRRGCPALEHAGEHTIPRTSAVTSLSSVDPTSALAATRGRDGKAHLFGVEVGNASELEGGAVAEATGDVVTFNAGVEAWVASPIGDELVLELRVLSRAIRAERIPFPFGQVVRMAGATVDGKLRMVWSTRSRWGSIDVEMHTATELGAVTLGGCEESGPGTLSLAPDGTGVVGFSNGDLLSFDLRTGRSAPLIRDLPRVCRAAYVRDADTGTEAVVTDREASILYWRQSPTEPWSSLELPTLTARALALGEGVLLAAGGANVVASVLFDPSGAIPPRLCDVESYGEHVTEVLALGAYALVAGNPEGDDLRMLWVRTVP